MRRYLNLRNVAATGVSLLVVLLSFFAWKQVHLFNPYSIAYSDLHSDFEEEVLTMNLSGETYVFADLVPFDWDTVSVFSEGTPREWIRNAIGVDVIRSPYYRSSRTLFVFCSNGRVVDVFGYPFGDIWSGGTFSSELEVQSGFLFEPSDSQVEANCS